MAGLGICHLTWALVGSPQFTAPTDAVTNFYLEVQEVGEKALR
jgi:hypothetical protein